MSDKEVVNPPTQRSGDAGDNAWSPDIVVGIDFGMTYTGRVLPLVLVHQTLSTRISMREEPC